MDFLILVIDKLITLEDLSVFLGKTGEIFEVVIREIGSEKNFMTAFGSNRSIINLWGLIF